jgi:hypothetical protein
MFRPYKEADPGLPGRRREASRLYVGGLKLASEPFPAPIKKIREIVALIRAIRVLGFYLMQHASLMAGDPSRCFGRVLRAGRHIIFQDAFPQTPWFRMTGAELLISDS